MAAADKVKNTTQQAKGTLKETAGRMVGNDRLRIKGKAGRTKADLKQAGENLKDALKK